MNLTDTGPLVALINRNDPNHTKCINAIKQLPSEPLLTTWPCLTEAMYLLHRVRGYQAQAVLWRMRAEGKLTLHNVSPDEVDRMATLMDKYQDKPMDLADASLVATAEKLGISRIFTLDSDFHIYRMSDGSAFTIVP